MLLAPSQNLTKMPVKKSKQNKPKNKNKKQQHKSSRTKQMREKITADKRCQPHILEDEKGVLTNVIEQEKLKPTGRAGVEEGKGKMNKGGADSFHHLQKGSGITATRYL